MKLELKNVTKRYGEKTALDKFSAELSEGVYGMLGPNGAGKSTLMNLITDNIKRTSGEILYDGEEILEMGSRFRNKIGYMPQQQGMYDSLSAIDFLYYMAAIKGIKRKEAKAEIERLLRVVSLEKEAHKKIGGFSGGMRQRVLLAQAIMGKPEVLILDEPTAGLDPEERIKTRNFIKDMSENMIVILATHVVSDVETIAGNIMLIKEGRLIEMASPKELTDRVWELEGKNKDREEMNLEDVYMHYLEK
ncbi:MAG: ATP-binding cassette domain-containing protein [Lachnospiraceae bacterium]